MESNTPAYFDSVSAGKKVVTDSKTLSDASLAQILDKVVNLGRNQHCSTGLDTESLTKYLLVRLADHSKSKTIC